MLIIWKLKKKAFLFADDKLILTASEDSVQKSLYQLSDFSQK
jgi:hypothetical protein